MKQPPDITLKPCPFCGSPAKFGYSDECEFDKLLNHRNDDGCWIYCTNDDCAISIGRNHEYEDDNWWGDFDSFEKAALLWNHRA